MNPIHTDRPVRVGVIGAGLIGRLRARAVGQVPGLRLAAVADTRMELVRHVVGSRKDVAIFSDGAALAVDPNVDAVIVATPPNSHRPLGLACLDAGKHVLCEKPLAPTPADCEELVLAADRAGVRLSTGFNLRYTRAARRARQLFDEGAIGALDYVRAYHGHPGGSEFTHDWVFDREVTGGGALMDNGIHLIDLVRWFLGGAAEVTGYATNHVWHKPGCEDNGFLLLKNAEDRVALFQASWTEWRGYHYRVELYGTDGFIRFGYPPLHLVHGSRTANGRVRKRRYIFPSYQIFERVRGWEWGLVETLAGELTDWATAIGGGPEAPASGHDGLEAVRIAHAARRCFATSRPPSGAPASIGK